MTTPELPGLVASGPAAAHADKLSLFGRLVGSWIVENSLYSEAMGQWSDSRVCWSFAWIIGGRGIQDVLEPRVGDGWGEPSGTTVRVYDATIDAWRVNWFSPKHSEFCSLIANRYRDGIRQDGTQSDGRPIRWNFSEITDDAFTWDGWCSNDDGATWWHEQHMTATRDR